MFAALIKSPFVVDKGSGGKKIKKKSRSRYSCDLYLSLFQVSVEKIMIIIKVVVIFSPFSIFGDSWF